MGAIGARVAGDWPRGRAVLRPDYLWRQTLALSLRAISSKLNQALARDTYRRALGCLSDGHEMAKDIGVV